MIFLIPWWFAILWTYTDSFPRPFDDWKNTLFYVGAGIILIYGMMKRVVRGGDPSAGWRAYSVNDSSPEQSRLDKSTGKPRDRTRFIIAIVALYFLICTISIALAPTARYEGLLALARLILWLGAAWVFAQLSSRQWIWLMRITVISAAIMAGLTWLQSRGTVIWPYGVPFLPPIGHISYYGDFIALSLVMAVGLLFQNSARNATGLVVWLLCMFLIDVGLALSATRASLLGVIAALCVAVPIVGYATRSLKKMGWIALVGGINLIVIFSLPITSLRGASASTRLQEVTNISQATLEAASSGRWHTYITSAHTAMERPIIGWGLGSFRFVYPEFAHRNAPDSQVSSATWYYHPHNEILHQAVEVGWLGAVLFLFGFVYLLYRGVRALMSGSPLINGHHCGDDDCNGAILLITSLCGLIVAVVSWQFSTNFLFPVSRLMTALFAGMLWKLSSHPSTVLSNSPQPPLILRGGVVIIALSTLLILTNQASIYCVQKEQMARDVRAQQEWATWAVRLAPGAFDPLYIRATVALHGMPPVQAAPDIEALYASYPYVPAVLHMLGYLRAQQGNIPEARKLLQHALSNDPINTAAKQLLDQLPPAH